MVDSRAKGYLYEVTNKTKSFIYIGITNNLSRRISEHKSSSHVKEVSKELASNLIFNTLCIGDYKYIAELEKRTIQLYRQLNYPIVNVLNGGEAPSGINGIDHWNSYLTEDQIILIRNLYAENKYTGRDLAKLFGTGYKNISKIVRGERWKTVGGPISLERKEVSKVANRAKILPEAVPLIREEALDRFILGELSIPKFAEELGIARGNLRLLLLGKTWSKLDGPLLKQDYWEDFGRGS